MFFCKRRNLIRDVIKTLFARGWYGRFVLQKNKKNADLYEVGEREDTRVQKIRLKDKVF